MSQVLAQPILRFTNVNRVFSEWCDSKVSDLGVIYSGGTPSTLKPEFWDGNIHWITPTDITKQDGIYIHSSARQISVTGLNSSSAKLLPKGTLLVCTRATIGDMAISSKEMCTNQGFKNIVPKNKTNIEFLYYLLTHHKRELIAKASGSTFLELSKSAFENLVFKIPSKEEQQKIASFLTSVDSKINQLTKKHRLLKEYKKGVMQQIFSQQLRLKDENGKAFPKWEEKTIGDVMTESRVKGSCGHTAKKLTVRIWGKGVVAKKDDGKGSENTQYYKRKAGQFIYGKLDFLNCAFAIIPEKLDGLESTLDLPSLDVSDAVNKFFILERVKQKSFYKQFGDIADGSRKAKRINVGVFQSMPILLPIKDEQDKIMNFFQSIDKKIDAVAQQVEQTKQFKKGLLQQMFV